MRSRLKQVIGLSTETETNQGTADDPTIRSAHERAKEEITRWEGSEAAFRYCEHCGGIFSSDMMYDHRKSSPDEKVREVDPQEGFKNTIALEPGDQFPDDAHVGEAKPCPGRDAE